jgi:3-keto-disaccharide hydrolase
MYKTFVLTTFVALAVTVAPAQDKKDNTPPKGFTALFNGKDLTNWQGLIAINQRAKLTPDELAKKQAAANANMLKHWTVKEGVIHYDGKNNNLQTAKDYGNFELYCDWKIGKKGDSGLYLRGNPQVQIWDNPEGSGGLYNNQKNPRKPLVNADKPVGEWNTFHIVMKGDKVTIHLNGKLVVDNTPLENYWERGKPLPARGPIELQHHGDPLWFKNIYVKELPD